MYKFAQNILSAYFFCYVFNLTGTKEFFEMYVWFVAPAQYNFEVLRYICSGGGLIEIA